MIQGADSGIQSKQEKTGGTTAQQSNHHEHRQNNKNNVIHSQGIRNKQNIKKCEVWILLLVKIILCLINFFFWRYIVYKLLDKKT
jgi:hypothetical protein